MKKQTRELTHTLEDDSRLLFEYEPTPFELAFEREFGRVGLTDSGMYIIRSGPTMLFERTLVLPEDTELTLGYGRTPSEEIVDTVRGLGYRNEREYFESRVPILLRDVRNCQESLMLKGPGSCLRFEVNHERIRPEVYDSHVLNLVSAVAGLTSELTRRLSVGAVESR